MACIINDASHTDRSRVFDELSRFKIGGLVIIMLAIWQLNTGPFRKLTYSTSSAECSKKLMTVPSAVRNIETCSTLTASPLEAKLECFSMYLINTSNY